MDGLLLIWLHQIKRQDQMTKVSPVCFHWSLLSLPNLCFNKARFVFVLKRWRVIDIEEKSVRRIWYSTESSNCLICAGKKPRCTRRCGGISLYGVRSVQHRCAEYTTGVHCTEGPCPWRTHLRCIMTDVKARGTPFCIVCREERDKLCQQSQILASM